MPRTKKTGLYYPKKGSAEAKAWGRAMQKLRKKKRRKQMSKCDCDHISHEKEMCKGKGVILTKASYGVVIICAKCNTEHPIPANFRK